MLYIKEKELKKRKLSEYLKMDKFECQYFCSSEQGRKIRTEYIMKIIGDVKLDEETYRLFLKQWQSGGGMYSVRTKKETIKGIYDIFERFPFLTADALSEIWFRYISDLFDEYSLEGVLEIYFDRFGKKDETFRMYLGFIDQVAIEHHQKYIEESKKIDGMYDEYSKEFISHLKCLIIKQHLSLDDIQKCLPSAEIIKRD